MRKIIYYREKETKKIIKNEKRRKISNKGHSFLSPSDWWQSVATDSSLPDQRNQKKGFKELKESANFRTIQSGSLDAYLFAYSPIRRSICPPTAYSSTQPILSTSPLHKLTSSYTHRPMTDTLICLSSRPIGSGGSLQIPSDLCKTITDRSEIHLRSVWDSLELIHLSFN